MISARCIIAIVLLDFSAIPVFAQDGFISGRITNAGKPIEGASVSINNKHIGTITDTAGNYFLQLQPGTYHLSVSSTGMASFSAEFSLLAGQHLFKNVTLKEEAGVLDEVVVTGVAGSSKIKSTPVAVAAVSKKEMQYNINANIIDALVKTIPGVMAVTTGPNISKPFIRGLGYNRVLTMFDGVRQEGQQWGDEHGIEIDQYSIVRAEVVKGPASLSYGSDAAAGALNLIPWFPSIDDRNIHGDALIEYQTNNGLVGSSIGFGQKVKHFEWAARASAKTATDYRNGIDGRVYATGFREINFSVMAGIENQKFKTYFYATAYNNLQEIPDGSRDSLTRKFTYQVKEADDDDIKNRPLVSKDALTSCRITALHQHIQHFRLYNKSVIKTGAGELTTLLGVQQNIRQEFNHPTQPSQAGLDVRLNTINYEVRHAFTRWKGIGITAGINGMYQDNKNQDATDFPIPDYHLFDIGTYLLAKKDIGKLSVSGGVRYDHRHVKWNDFYTTTNPATGFEQQVKDVDTAGTVLRFKGNRQSFRGISASGGFTYNMSAQWLVKANVARGYRAPNITETAANGLDPGAHIYYIGNIHFKPEFNWQEDLGIFYTGRDVSGSLETFDNRISNYIFLQKLLNADGTPLQVVVGNSTYKYVQASAQLYGLEASVTFHPGAYKWLTFKNSVAFITGLNKDNDLKKQYGNAAKYLPMLPPLHTLSTLHTVLPVKSKAITDFYLQAELEYYDRQDHFYAVDNTETATPGYSLVNVGAGLSYKNKKGKNICQFYINANNVFNKAYQSHLNRLKYFEYYEQSPTGHLGIYNMGRNICFKTIFNF